MATQQSTVTSRGQITLPASMRRRLGLGEGDRVDIDQQGDTLVVRRASTLSVTEQTAGALSKYATKQPVTPEEEREAFERLVAEEVVSSMEHQ
jgi:antitoxin PrlF